MANRRCPGGRGSASSLFGLGHIPCRLFLQTIEKDICSASHGHGLLFLSGGDNGLENSLDRKSSKQKLGHRRNCLYQCRRSPARTSLTSFFH